MLLWCLVCFVGGQMALGLVIDYAFPEYRFPWFYRLVEQAGTVKSPETILCLGSSRFGTGLFAGELTAQLRQVTGSSDVTVINASVPGGDYITSERMLKMLVDRGMRPRLVLLEFCPELLNSHMGWLNLHTTRTLCWHDLPTFGAELASLQQMQRFAMCRLFPLAQYRQGIRTRLKDQWLPKDDSERTFTEMTDQHWTVELEQPAWPVPKQMAELANHFVKYEIGGQPVACFERMLRRCEEEQISVVLVEPPMTQVHRQHYIAEIERQYQAYYQQLHSRHDLSRFSYRDAVPDSEFYDHHHCLRSGAKLWGEKVVQEVLAPAWVRLTQSR